MILTSYIDDFLRSFQGIVWSMSAQVIPSLIAAKSPRRSGRNELTVETTTAQVFFRSFSLMTSKLSRLSIIIIYFDMV